MNGSSEHAAHGSHQTMDHSSMHEDMHSSVDHAGMDHGSHLTATSEACGNMGMHGMSVCIIQRKNSGADYRI